MNTLEIHLDNAALATKFVDEIYSEIVEDYGVEYALIARALDAFLNSFEIVGRIDHDEFGSIVTIEFTYPLDEEEFTQIYAALSDIYEVRK